MKNFFKISIFFTVLLPKIIYPNDKLFYNIAETIVSKPDQQILAILSPRRYFDSNKAPVSKYTPPGTPLIISFYKEAYPAMRIEATERFCYNIDSFIFIKMNYVSTDQTKKLISMRENDLWLVILKPMFKQNSRIFTSESDKIIFKGIEKYPFINNETFFSIPIPQVDYAICLFRVPSDESYPYRKDPYIDPIELKKFLLEDVKKLTNLFCDKKENLFNLGNIDLITKTIPTLKSKEGKEIAEAMINIIEDEIIKVEFPEEVKKETEKSLPKLNIEAVEKVYNSN